MSYDLVIFDMDGVLLNSSLDDFRWMDRIRARKAREKGYNISADDAEEIIKSKNYNELVETLDRLEIPEKQMIEIEKKVQHVKMYLIENGAINLFPETRKLLDQIDAKKGIATNSPLKVMEHTLNFFEIEKKVDHAEAQPIEDIETFYKRKKPSTFMLNKIIRETNSSKPLMVGDSTDDIKAAKRTGIDSVHVNITRSVSDMDPKYSINSLENLKKIL